MKHLRIIFSLIFMCFSASLFAQDISGIWNQIDDKTGTSKALIEIKKLPDNTYAATIIKVTPRPGYTPKTHCQNCPAPYTGKAILGLQVIKDLKQSDKDPKTFEGGKILDPLSGNIYSCRVKMSSNGKRIALRGYLGVSMIGRSQTWIRYEE